MTPVMSGSRQNIRPLTRLKACRLDKGLTLEQVAEAIQVSPRSLYRWEQAGALPQSAPVVKRLIDYYGVSSVRDLWPVEDVAA